MSKEGRKALTFVTFIIAATVGNILLNVTEPEGPLQQLMLIFQWEGIVVGLPFLVWMGLGKLVRKSEFQENTEFNTSGNNN